MQRTFSKGTKKFLKPPNFQPFSAEKRHVGLLEKILYRILKNYPDNFFYLPHLNC